MVTLGEKTVVGEMTYDVMGRRVLDYETCFYEGSRLYFRGPKHDLSRPYVAFIGATDTFGKFIARPFPERVCTHLPEAAVNLGMIGGGIDAYLNDRAILNVAKQAELRVVQVMGALNLSNYYFRVHPRRNDRLIAPQEALTKLYPEIDFAEFHFTKAMLRALKRHCERRYAMVCRELQDIWLARMTMLLALLGEPTVLMWFAHQAPPQDALQNPQEPMLINTDLIARMRGKASAYVEVVPDAQAQAQGTDGMYFGALEEPAAAKLMGSHAHEQAEIALQEPCRHLLKKA